MRKDPFEGGRRMIDKKRSLWIYNKMNEIRNFELKALELFEENKLRGSVHLYIGEEAVAATICSSLRDEDYITSTHRGHGHCIAKGAELDKAMAELMGKATGYCRGRGGSMHIADLTKGNLGANGIVGGGLPIATGAALASKMRGQDRVAVSFFGDGASNEGTFHESLNLRPSGSCPSSLSAKTTALASPCRHGSPRLWRISATGPMDTTCRAKPWTATT